MKARVKATGEIITIESDTMFIGKNYKGVVKTYYDSDIDIIKDEPDYWEKLKHQAVIAAMQGLMSKEILDTPDSLLSHAIHYATALVNKLKEESLCEK